MSAATVRLGEVVGNLDIEQWIQQRYGFVPHPFWIDHCKELYIEGGPSFIESRPAQYECPSDKRAAIREAFIHFGLLSE